LKAVCFIENTSICRSDPAVGKKMEGPEVTFIFQFGLVRDTVTAAANTLGLKTLKDLACDFIDRKVGTACILRHKTHEALAYSCVDQNMGTALRVLVKVWGIVGFFAAWRQILPAADFSPCIIISILCRMMNDKSPCSCFFPLSLLNRSVSVAVMLWTCIWEVLGLNFGRDISCPNRFFVANAGIVP
jgi:hypothetical protein